MQLSEIEFKEYIQADLKARGQVLSIIQFIKDPISRFHWYLRLLEYMQNRKLLMPFRVIIKILFLRLSQRLSFSIPINTLGKGVYLPHWGTIVVNSKSFVGDYSVINVDVVIGRHPMSKTEVPVIGRSVYIAPGVKMFGGVNIGDECIIGANSVVTKSFPERRLLLGIPAKSSQQITDTMLTNYGMKQDNYSDKSVVFLGGRGIYSNYGGVENAIREIVTEMSAKPINIKVYGVKGDQDNIFELPDNISSINIPDKIYKTLGQHGYILFCVLHILLTSRPSVVVIFASGPCIFTPIFRLFGIKVVTSLRAIDSDRDKWGVISRSVLQLGELFAWKYANFFTVNSHAMVDHYHAYREDVRFIPNGAKEISAENITDISEYGLSRNNYFLFASRLDPVKRLHILLEAYSKLAEQDRIPLVIAGGHVKDQKYEAELKAYSCDNVLFLGHLNSDHLAPLMKHCRAFILPSILEGMSNSLLSAMASSKAVLAADIPENRDVVFFEEVLFEKDNVEALYQKLKKFSRDDNYCKTIGLSLHKISDNKYSWLSTANKFYNLIEDPEKSIVTKHNR